MTSTAPYAPDRLRRLCLSSAAAAGLALATRRATARTATLYDGPLFDAHLHYNDDAQSPYPVADVLDRLRRSGMRGALVNSRPNEGSMTLAEAHAAALAAGVQVVPFVRPYRDHADYRRWFADPAIFDLVESWLARPTPAGPFRGIGEFHVYDNADADGPIARRLVQLARQRGLAVFAHCDDVAIERLMAHAPGVTLIWAHTGIGGTPAARVAELLERHPTLRGELSYRPDLTGDDGLLSPAWRALLLRWPQRFLVGSDTWVNARWERYGELMQAYRHWLGALPPVAARQIGWDNGAALFGLRA